MIVEVTRNDRWLSNTWLVADEPGGKAVLVDTGGPTEPIWRALDEHRLELTHVLCTHHHYDHVMHNEEYASRAGCPICGHAAERQLFGHLDVELADGEELVTGGLHVRALHIPGHTVGQLAFLVNDARVFTGDTLFQGSVGGTRAPGHATYGDLRASIMDVLMALPPETIVHPGHMEPTTIAREWEENPFVRHWRDLDSAGHRDCTAFGEPATLLVGARDYDGGTKCLVRFADTGEVDVVPGSKVVASDA